MAYNMNEDDDDWDSDDLEEDEDESDDYDEDPELDDDEEDTPRPNRYIHPEERAAKEDAARSRRLIWSLFKVCLSVVLIGGVCFYLFAPNGKSTLQNLFSGKTETIAPYVQQAKQKIETAYSRLKGDKGAEKPATKPMLGRRPAPVKERPAPVAKPAAEPVAKPALAPVGAPVAARPDIRPVEKPLVRVKPASGRQFNLSGAGDLPDLQTAMKTNPALKEALLKDKSVYTLERLWELESFVQKFVLMWAGTDSEQVVENKVKMSYATFVRRTMTELLPFTTFKTIGLTPSYDINYVKESPTEAIGKFYQALSPVLAEQTTEKGIETLRPVVRFMKYRCGRDKECTESLEMMIQMLGYDDKKDELMK